MVVLLIGFLIIFFIVYTAIKKYRLRNGEVNKSIQTTGKIGFGKFILASAFIFLTILITVSFQNMGFALFIFGIIVFFALIIFLNVKHKHDHYGRFITFDEYKIKHPELVKKGVVECFNCGSDKIRSAGLSSAVDTLRTHSCIICGTALYKTKT
jgi:amino acid transporter